MENLPQIPEEFLKPLNGETEVKWLQRMRAAKIDFGTALKVIKDYRKEQTAKAAKEKYRRLGSGDGFGPTGPKNPGE